MSNFNLALALLRKGPQHLSALLTVKFDPFEHGPDTAATGDDAADFDKAVELVLAEVTEGVAGWHVGDADVDFWVDLVVRGEV